MQAKDVCILERILQYESNSIISKKETDMEKRIVMRRGTAGRLREEFGVSDVTVRSALCYRTDSYLSRELRRRALELGGQVVEFGEGEEAPVEEGTL